jgi:transcriptional regulator with XRE-family HTH domain
MARDSLASPLPARERFASQVRHLRAQKGFGTARSFARALGIEENRYTRYERAEVEPSLTLIHKTCVTLQVSPSDLFGFPESAPGRS